MKIIPHGSDVYEFNSEEIKFIVCAEGFEAAKKEFLSFIESSIEQELQRMFIEFNKKYYTNLNEKDI